MELWVFYCAILLSGAFLATATTSEEDVTALKSISNGFKGGLRWSGDTCGWTGVECDATRTNVTKLILNGRNIQGRLLPSIGNLANLNTLDLSYNPDLRGELPKSLGNLQNLVILNLQGCGFTGSIPAELGRLKKLNFLALNRNQLSGTIPAELGGLMSCTWFDLSENQLTGTLPISTTLKVNMGLDNLTAAVHFHLNNNSFSGSFPIEVTSLPNLKHLLLDSNQFTGEIPPEVGNFKELTILRLDNNGFSGALPSNVTRISKLTELHAKNNKLTGVLPDLTTMASLMLVSVGNNSFDPQPVPSFSGMTKMQTIEINSANLLGPIPTGFFELPDLESVSLKGNQINGTVDFSTASTSLGLVELDNNDIASVLVAGNFSLSLAGNPACADERLSLSSAVCHTEFSEVWRPNSTCQKVCSSSGMALNLRTCSCQFALSFTILFTSPTFSNLNAERLDDALVDLSNTTRIPVDQMSVDGANLTEKHRLYVNMSLFSTNTKPVDPLTVSFIVRTISTHMVDFRFGPYSLAGFVFSPAAVQGKGGLSTGAIAGIAAAGGLILLAVVAVSLYAVNQKKRADKAVVSSNPFASWGSQGKDSGSAPQLKGARFFTVAEMRKATNNFSSSNEIGVGGYGKVYRGKLVTGEDVAIKRAQEGSLQGGHEFKTEIELLSRVHHRNLVGLIGFCYEHGEQMLVYEFMLNGNLRDLLTVPSPVLNWRKRLEIAVGSARGLAYLHELANPPIIHRDIKSTNILLDDRFVAKVADFGLSKLVPPTGKNHISTQVKGTLGYLDPEYYMTQQLTEKSDVYSFGIVLLELVTARMPIENNKYIVREVKGALGRGGFQYLVEVLDPSLRDYPEKDLAKFVELALECVDESASGRPTMSEVAKELEVLLSNVSSSGFSKDSSSSHKPHMVYDMESMSDDPRFQYSSSGGFPAKVEPK